MAEICANCDRSIGKLETAHLHNQQIVCSDCIALLARPAAAAAAATSSAAPRVGKGPVCQLCGGRMKKKTKTSGNCLGLAIALLLFFAGLLITVLFWWTIVALFVGPLIMLCALFVGGKKSKVWQCVKCKSVAPRG